MNPQLLWEGRPCMLNILRWYALCKNVHGFYSYYRPVGVTVSGVGVASVVELSEWVSLWVDCWVGDAISLHAVSRKLRNDRSCNLVCKRSLVQGCSCIFHLNKSAVKSV